MNESSYDPMYGEAFWCNACGQDQERSCGQDRATTRLPVGVYLRRSYRDGGKVKHEQLANLSALPEAAITAIEAVLAGATMVPAETVCMITRSLPHGHVAAVTAMARKLGWPALLGPAC